LRDLAVSINLPNAEIGARAEAIKRVSGKCTVHETICKMNTLPINVYDKSAVREKHDADLRSSAS
jgi:putative redox protein